MTETGTSEEVQWGVEVWPDTPHNRIDTYTSRDAAQEAIAHLYGKHVRLVWRNVGPWSVEEADHEG